MSLSYTMITNALGLVSTLLFCANYTFFSIYYFPTFYRDNDTFIIQFPHLLLPVLKLHSLVFF